MDYTRAAMARLAPYLFVLLWSSAFVAVRAGLPDVTPLYFLAVRFALAAAILVGACFALRAAWRTLTGVWPHYVAAGVMLNAVYLSASYLALQDLSSAVLALLGALHPIIVALLSGPLLDERFRTGQWLGFGLGLLGVAIVVGVDLGEFGSMRGMAWGLGAVAVLIGGTLYHRRYCTLAPPLVANAVQLSAGAAATALFVLLFEEPAAQWTPTAIATLLHLAFAVSIGGMGLFLYMLRTGAAGQVGTNFYLTPGTTAVLGWVILGETLSWPQFAGIVIASVGVWLVRREPAMKRAA
jgi:drug/metabolite transporter (DMT)-like permease